MTKKDFELVAATLRKCKPVEVVGDQPYSAGALHTWHATVGALCTAFAAQNIAFNRERFLKACGAA